MGTPGMQGDVSAETSAAGKSGLLQLLRTDRQCAQALTRRGKYRIAEGGGNQWHRGFADAAGRLVAVHEMHVEFGQFVVAQQPIIIEVGLLHSAAYDSHVAPQGGGETDNPASARCLDRGPGAPCPRRPVRQRVAALAFGAASWLGAACENRKGSSQRQPQVRP